MFSPLDQFDSVILVTFFNIFDKSFTSTMFPIILLFVFILVFYSLNFILFNLIPDFWQLAFENLYLFILNLIEEQIGAKGYTYFPLILTLFLLILFCNVISMTPFGIAMTGHISAILFLTVSLGFFNFFLGFRTHGILFLRLFLPECPFLLLPLLIVIEIFSYVLRNISLAIRLSANIMAGHTLVFIVSSFLVKIFYFNYYLLFFIVFLLLFAILMLEVGVACLQAYVFVILFCIYLSDSLNGSSH